MTITIDHNPACGTARNTLAHAQQGAFTQEDGEAVINHQGQRV